MPKVMKNAKVAVAIADLVSSILRIGQSGVGFIIKSAFNDEVPNFRRIVIEHKYKAN